MTSSAPASVFNVPDAVQEWADLGTPIQPVMAADDSGDVEVVVKGMSARYLGLARIWVDSDGHIQRGRVELNQAYLNSLTAAEWDHVLCQELGHILGLDHNEDGPAGGSPDDTCMNGSEYLGLYTGPNGHDAAELTAKYDHVDEAPPPDEDDGPGGGNCPPGNPNHKNCQPANGRWITIHVFEAP